MIQKGSIKVGVDNKIHFFSLGQGIRGVERSWSETPQFVLMTRQTPGLVRPQNTRVFWEPEFHRNSVLSDRRSATSTFLKVVLLRVFSDDFYGAVYVNPDV